MANEREGVCGPLRLFALKSGQREVSSLLLLMIIASGGAATGVRHKQPARGREFRSQCKSTIKFGPLKRAQIKSCNQSLQRSTGRRRRRLVAARFAATVQGHLLPLLAVILALDSRGRAELDLDREQKSGSSFAFSSPVREKLSTFDFPLSTFHLPPPTFELIEHCLGRRLPRNS